MKKKDTSKINCQRVHNKEQQINWPMAVTQTSRAKDK